VSDTITLKNKTTGETITLRRKSIKPKEEKKTSEMGQVTPGVNVPQVNTDEAIASRGTIASNIKDDLSSPNMARKVLGAVGIMGAPLNAIRSAVANPALEMQKGNFNPGDLAMEAWKGVSGQKQGRYIDVYRRAGVPAPAASGLDFVLSSSPLKAVQVAKKAISAVAKMSDKGIMKAGESLIKATDEAEKFVGSQVGEAFKKVETLKVDPTTLYNSISKLPKVLLSKLEETFGNLEDFAQNATVGKVRELKHFVGKYRPSAFGKTERGLAENIDAEDMNNAYRSLKSLLSETVEKATDSKTAANLMKLEKSYSDVRRASDYVKKTVVDSTLRKPTKAGNMAGKLVVEGDVSGRDALNTLRKSGKVSKKQIDKAISSLEAFNRWRAMAEFGKHAANAALYGGAIGGLGGYVGGKLYRDQQD